MAKSPRDLKIQSNVIETAVDESSTLLCHPVAMDAQITESHARRQIITISLCALAIIFVDMGCFLTSAPQLRLFESIICRNHYRSRDPGVIDRHGQVPEHLCKINVVQDEIAFIDGYQMLFDNIPALFLAVPLGVLAERWGRKPVLVLNFIGLTLAPCWILFVCYIGIPIRLTWLSSMAFILGGGPTMAPALILMMIADVTGKAQRRVMASCYPMDSSFAHICSPIQSRATIFFQIQAAVLISELVAPPIGSALMTRNLWLPMFLGVAIQACCIGVALFMPETRGSPTSAEPVPTINAEEIEPCLSEEEEEGHSGTIKLSKIDHYHEGMSFLQQNWDVALLVLTFLIASIGRQSMSVFLQYTSKRYGWILANANYLISLRAVVSLILLVVVLPTISTIILTRFGKDAATKDLAIARTSIVLMSSGFFIIAISPTAVTMIIGLMTYTFGTGFSASVRSVVTLMVAPEHVPRLYTSIALSDTVGSLVAGPFLALMFHLGLGLGGAWLGLPFLVSAGMMALVGVLVFAVGVPRTDIKSREQMLDVGGA